MTATTTVDPKQQRIAHAVSEALSPVVLVFALLLVVVAVHGAGLWRGLLIGFIAAFFAGGFPYAVLLLGIRRGHLGDRHLTRRQERPAMLVIGLVSLTVGLIVTAWLHAPKDVYALVAAMIVGVAVALTITLFWKISIHTATCAGSVAVLAIVFGPFALLTGILVIGVAWARVAVKAHTVLQVSVGGIVGALVATVVMLLL